MEIHILKFAQSHWILSGFVHFLKEFLDIKGE